MDQKATFRPVPFNVVPSWCPIIYSCTKVSDVPANEVSCNSLNAIASLKGQFAGDLAASSANSFLEFETRDAVTYASNKFTI